MISTNSETKSADVRLRLEPELKEAAARILADAGLELSIAIRLFLKQVVAHRGLPFEVGQPNAATIRAMRQAEIHRKGAGRDDRRLRSSRNARAHHTRTTRPTTNSGTNTIVAGGAPKQKPRNAALFSTAACRIYRGGAVTVFI